MNRILVIGCCGSGKSTFAQKLAAHTGLPLVYLDQLFWKPGWVESSQEEFDAALGSALKAPQWIIDGNYSRTLPWRLEACDQVFYFQLPRFQCILGVVRRVLTTHGKVRPDMAEGCPERLNLEFLRYTWGFEKSQGEKIRQAIAASGKPCTVFHSHKQAERYLKSTFLHGGSTNANTH
jgi:adenylate kinase family enzyme